MSVLLPRRPDFGMSGGWAGRRRPGCSRRARCRRARRLYTRGCRARCLCARGYRSRCLRARGSCTDRFRSRCCRWSGRTGRRFTTLCHSRDRRATRRCRRRPGCLHARGRRRRCHTSGLAPRSGGNGAGCGRSHTSGLAPRGGGNGAGCDGRSHMSGLAPRGGGNSSGCGGPELRLRRLTTRRCGSQGRQAPGRGLRDGDGIGRPDFVGLRRCYRH
jgi:hypothetical protein